MEQKIKNIDPDYDEEDERLDRELFELIFKGADLPEGMTYNEAVGAAIAAAIPEDEKWETLAKIRPREHVEFYRTIGMPFPRKLEDIDDFIKEIEEFDEKIEIPSRETFDEWIRMGEERRLKRELDELIKNAENRIYGYTLEEWNSMSEEDQIQIQNKHEYDAQHSDQAEWFIE